MTEVTLNRLRTHLVAASERGGPLAHYAREQGVSKYMLYEARRQLRKQLPGERKNLRPAAHGGKRSSPFVAVRVAPSAARCKARLPNGIELEFGEFGQAGYADLLGLLAKLPCSA